MYMHYPCPCCGYIVMSLPPGSYDICPLCFWEDDDTQLAHFTMSGGANAVSLLEAQKNYEAFGVSERKYLDNVRVPKSHEIREKTWRPIDTTRDIELAGEYPLDSSALYYWRR